MKVCKDVEDWIEENVEQEIKKQEQRCKKWPWPLSWLCSLVTFIAKVIVTIWTKIIRVVCEVVTVVINAGAAVANFILAFPIIGPLIKALIRLVVGILAYIVGLFDGLGRLIGIRTTKHLRVHVVPLCIGNIPLAYESHLAPIMRETERILYDRAGIRVHTTFHDPLRNPPEDALRLGTEVDLILDELWLKGAWHQLQTIKMFESNLSSLVGIGHPIVVYVIREVGYDGIGNVIGASGGPFVDWVAVERDSVIPTVAAAVGSTTDAAVPPAPYPSTLAGGADPGGVENINFHIRTVAHEICHTLGLLGHENSDPGELMVSGKIEGDALSPLQVGIIRGSSHLTYW